jgi:hypothetical protein
VHQLARKPTKVIRVQSGVELMILGDEFVVGDDEKLITTSNALQPKNEN